MTWYQVLELLRNATPLQVAIGLTALSMLMLVIEDRRFSLVPLLMQYILLGSLVGTRILAHVVAIRLGLGLAICLILYISATRVQHELHELRASVNGSNVGWSAAFAGQPFGLGLAEVNPIFRLLAMFLGALIAYGMWRAYPLPFVPTEIIVASYGLVSIGVLLTLISVDPLRMGLGVLTFVNGFEALYLFLEQSLVVMTLVGVMEIVLALGIVVCTEAWLESLKGEVAA